VNTKVKEQPVSSSTTRDRCQTKSHFWCKWREGKVDEEGKKGIEESKNGKVHEGIGPSLYGRREANLPIHVYPPFSFFSA
jgi:hypothetical protein